MKTIVRIEELGEVTLYRKRGVKNLRIRVNNNGLVVLTMPRWMPKKIGLGFLLKHRSWILEKISIQFYADDKTNIGKAFVLGITNGDNAKISSKVEGDRIEIFLPKDQVIKSSQDKIKNQINKALKSKCEAEVHQMLDRLAEKHQLPYKSVKFRKLSSRWGSCSNEKRITISIFAVLLEKELIDYILLHELVHTKYLHHKKDFWTELEHILPNAKSLKRKLADFSPCLFS